VRHGDVLEYDDLFLTVWLGQTPEDGSGDFLRLIEPADFRVGRDLVGVESVLVEEACPCAVLIRVADAEGCGSFEVS